MTRNFSCFRSENFFAQQQFHRQQLRLAAAVVDAAAADVVRELVGVGSVSDGEVVKADPNLTHCYPPGRVQSG